MPGRATRMAGTGPWGEHDQQPAVRQRPDLVALGGLEVRQSVPSEPPVILADDQLDLPVEHQHERVLVDLVLVQALAPRQRQEYDPVGVIVGSQHARGVRGDVLAIQVPELHEPGS